MDFRITIIVFCSSSLPLTPILHRYSCRSLPQPSHIQAKASGQSRSSRKSKQKVIADAFSPHTSYSVSKLDSFIGRAHCGPEMGNAISELNDLCAVVAFILFFLDATYSNYQCLFLPYMCYSDLGLSLLRATAHSPPHVPQHTRARTHTSLLLCPQSSFAIEFSRLTINVSVSRCSHQDGWCMNTVVQASLRARSYIFHA